VHAAPLDKLAVREAVAMAINRKHLVQLLGGHALAATQMYNPYDAQYDPALVRKPIYPYDPKKAAALLKSSGYQGQPVSVFYANDLQRNLSLAPGVQQDLGQIGLNASLRGMTDASLGSIRSALTGHQIDFNGWGIDYPDGWDIYSGELACGDNGAGGGGGAHYCDPVADRLANQAEALPLGVARDALLRQAQVRLLQAAARIPLVYLKPTEMVAPRVHGFYYHPIFGWQYENYWVTP
jgi:ABC-type transport system substrate-binding protein